LSGRRCTSVRGKYSQRACNSDWGGLRNRKAEATTIAMQTRGAPEAVQKEGREQGVLGVGVDGRVPPGHRVLRPVDEQILGREDSAKRRAGKPRCIRDRRGGKSLPRVRTVRQASFLNRGWLNSNPHTQHPNFPPSPRLVEISRANKDQGYGKIRWVSRHFQRSDEGKTSGGLDSHNTQRVAIPEGCFVHTNGSVFCWPLSYKTARVLDKIGGAFATGGRGW